MKKLVVCLVVVVCLLGCYCKSCRAGGCNGDPVEVPVDKVRLALMPCGDEGTIAPDMFEFVVVSTVSETSFTAPCTPITLGGRTTVDLWPYFALDPGLNTIKYRAISVSHGVVAEGWDTVGVVYKAPPPPPKLGRYSVYAVISIKEGEE